MAKQAPRRGNAGGGEGSKQHVRQGVRTGTGVHVKREAGTAQVGLAVDPRAREKINTAKGGPNQVLGNEAALRVGAGKPGADRTIYASGSQQGMAKTPAPIGPTRDTLAEFGPDVPGRG